MTEKKAYERLIEYAAYPTGSDENCDDCPSSPEQRDLSEALVKELLEIGVAQTGIDENGYVYASIPANTDKKGIPAIGFIAHVDVVRDVEFRNVKPRVIENYNGGDILLNAGLGITMRTEDFPVLKKYTGKTLVVTDGTTLLGADDKAGVAEIMTLASHLMSDDTIKHGEIKIGFTPDEEIGRGADKFDIERFGAEYAYTVDGAAFGEVEYENFNAAAMSVTVNGVSIHPGSAKNKMVNSITVAREFDSLLPPLARPEHTEGYEGFFHPISVQGAVEKTVTRYIIRDHDSRLLEMKKEYALRAAEEINRRYGEETCVVEIEDSYKNMKEKILPHFHLIEKAYEAVRQCGGEPVSVPVRGGTDGCKLSFMGLPCPNLGTGSHNHHGRFEFACAEDMERVTDCMVKIAQLYAE